MAWSMAQGNKEQGSQGAGQGDGMLIGYQLSRHNDRLQAGSREQDTMSARAAAHR